jgi:ankyrin repeat protein
MKVKIRQTLHEVLQSTSESLFPAEMGKKVIDINTTDCEGDTPLHVLISRGNTAGALLLIENGANINAVGDMGETPLHLAIRRKDLKIISALLNNNAKTNIVSEFGKSASQEAIEIGIKLS